MSNTFHVGKHISPGPQAARDGCKGLRFFDRWQQPRPLYLGLRLRRSIVHVPDVDDVQTAGPGQHGVHSTTTGYPVVVTMVDPAGAVVGCIEERLHIGWREVVASWRDQCNLIDVAAAKTEAVNVRVGEVTQPEANV